MRLKIAYSKVKKRNLVLINNDTYQRETVSERPIRPPLSHFIWRCQFLVQEHNFNDQYEYIQSNLKFTFS